MTVDVGSLVVVMLVLVSVVVGAVGATAVPGSSNTMLAVIQRDQYTQGYHMRLCCYEVMVGRRGDEET